MLAVTLYNISELRKKRKEKIQNILDEIKRREGLKNAPGNASIFPKMSDFIATVIYVKNKTNKEIKL